MFTMKNSMISAQKHRIFPKRRRRNSTQRTMWSLLDDLDLADDLALLSQSYAQMQGKATCLESTSARTGLHIKNSRTKIMKMQHGSNSPVIVAGQPLEQVYSFTNLGHMVNTQGGTDLDERATHTHTNTHTHTHACACTHTHTHTHTLVFFFP